MYQDLANTPELWRYARTVKPGKIAGFFGRSVVVEFHQKGEMHVEMAKSSPK